MTSHLEVEVKEKVLEIKINKPKVNAIDLKLSQDLGKAFAELRDNPDLRVGIITGEGDKIFSACLLYTSPSPRDVEESRMPSSA